MLATVKGDVHDIGKNIVGVVLGCNNYEVIDLGVMVPADRILDTAAAEGADFVGLSGLITPSLDEMVDVAKEMERRGLALPLLIGGATTSKQHTAVRIAPAYTGPTVHVLDASRVIGAVSSLLDPARIDEFDRENRELQERLREQYAERDRKPLLPLEAARANRQRVSFDDLAVPPFTGVRTVEPDLVTVCHFVDWQFFFHAWELKGKFPAILERPEARELYDDALALLDEITSNSVLQARGVYGFWPARAEGDDVVLEDGTRFCFLRQQSDYGDERPNRCLADYVAPAGDAIGAFAVGIHGAGELAARYEAEHDDYRSIMVKALADRLAEAFAEWLHAEVRRDWYAPDEQLSSEDLAAERYRGIRPAFGYPACPDHTEKGKLFELLGAGGAGLELTETYATMPAASVSGIYLAHPEARYFSVGRVARDQVEDYAARQGIELGGGRAAPAAKPGIRTSQSGRCGMIARVKWSGLARCRARRGSRGDGLRRPGRPAEEVHEGRPGPRPCRLPHAPRLRRRLEVGACDQERQSNPRCSTYNPDQSDLVEIGDYDSPDFSRPDGTFVSSTTGVFKTAAMARTGYARVAVPALPHCFAEIFKKGITKPSSATIFSSGPLSSRGTATARTRTGSRPRSRRRRAGCGRRSTWWCSTAARSTSRSSSWASTRRCPRASSSRSSPRSPRGPVVASVVTRTA